MSDPIIEQEPPGTPVFSEVPPAAADVFAGAAELVVPLEAPPSDLPTTNIDKLTEAMSKYHQRLDDLEQQVASIPRQIQLLSNRIGGLASSVNDPRSKALLLDLLRMHDLIDQFIRSLNSTSQAGSEACQGFELLQREVRQILALNGLVEIPADGAFNPEMHRAMRRVPVDDPAKSNRVATILKPGFRAEQGTILRYAEVEVWHHQPPVPAAPTQQGDQQ